MAGLKEIRRRIKSVRSTKKITYAMKLVSAVKLRKAQDAVLRARDYTASLAKLMADVMREQDHAPVNHPLISAPEKFSKIRCLIIGGTRGLCGAYNMNVNKFAEQFLASKTAEGLEVQCVTLGKKPLDYFRHRKLPLFKSYDKLPEDPLAWPVEEIIAEAEEAFLKGEIGEVYVIYTRFKSAISISVTLDKLLPFEQPPPGPAGGAAPRAPSGLTLFEPSAQEVFSTLVPLCLRVRFRQAALDSKASEHGSRMTAM